MNEKNIKTILSFLILLVAFSILLIFVNNKDALMSANTFPIFMTLSTVGLGLLAGLLFLIGKPSAKVSVRTKKVVHSTKKKRKR
ncbi:MAG TPA: hypothetical protein VF189_00525 [Patescibacteria group bacterium]